MRALEREKELRYGAVQTTCTWTNIQTLLVPKVVMAPEKDILLANFTFDIFVKSLHCKIKTFLW